MQIFSFSPFGYEGSLVTVEVDLRRGIPAVDVVGLADGAVKESRERMRSAIRNSGFEFPVERVLISLSPADLRKEGAGFDLALALAVLNAQKQLEKGSTDDTDCVLVMGELELSGALRGVKGVHAAASTAMAQGIKKCIVSSVNQNEAREVKGMRVFGAENLEEAYRALCDDSLFSSGDNSGDDSFLPEGSQCIDGVQFACFDPSFDFKDIYDQKKLVRALQIAASGGHNVLAWGPPGCGKTLAMQRFPSIVPLLTVDEAQSVTRIHSLAGLLGPNMPLMRVPPFRMPHQTASIEGICGGGINCRPGEISLAHNGVLFLDEAAEFKSSVLQMLRVPLESGSITLSRAGRSTCYPARFQLLMASNPCPCGNYGCEGRLCLCSARSVEQYWRKFSGPLLDRIDIRVSVNQGEKNEGTYRISSQELRHDIARAVKTQRERQGKRNAYLTPQEILFYCNLGSEEKAFLDKISISGDFSQRSVSSILKVSRTIADMEGKSDINISHLKEAADYRANSGPLAVFSGSLQA